MSSEIARETLRPELNTFNLFFQLTEYTSVVVILFYTLWGWLAIHSASIASHHFELACNESHPPVKWGNTLAFMFINTNSVIIGMFSVLFLSFALIFYSKSLLKTWNKYRSESKQNPGSLATDICRDDFFKHLAIEVIGTFAAIYLIDYLHHHFDERHFAHEECNGNWLEMSGKFSAYIRYSYAALASIMTYMFAYIGIIFCTLGFYQSWQNWRVQSDQDVESEEDPALREERPSQNGQGFPFQISGNFHGPINANSRPLNAQLETNENAQVPLSGILQLNFNGAPLANKDGQAIVDNNDQQAANGDESENVSLLEDKNDQLFMLGDYSDKAPLL